MRNLFLARETLLAFLATSRQATGRSRSFRSATLMGALPTTQYVLRYDYVTDVLEKRGPHREKHLELAKDLCLNGGPSFPIGQEVPTGAFFTFENVEKAKKFVEEDPYVTSGIVTGHTIEEWNVAIQN